MDLLFSENAQLHFTTRAFFIFFKKFFKTPLWFALSQCELVKGLLIDSDKEQLFRCSLKIEYQVHRTSVLMISHLNGYAKTSVWNEREPPL